MIQAINTTNSNIQIQARTNTAYLSAPQDVVTGAAYAAPAGTVQMPTADRNYCIFDQARVDYFVSQKEQALPYLKQVLQTSEDEKEIVEALYILDRMIDNGTKGIPAMYPVLSRFNNTKSQNIQAFLAGIYRKIQVPDAFGPLVAMLIRNSYCRAGMPDLQPTLQSSNPPTFFFDPNEEIGGAILAYIENYSHNPPKIDYSA